MVSVITEMELLSYPALSDTEAEQIRGFLREIEIVGLTEAVKTRAILLRRMHGIKLPDAIVAAIAITSDAEICTNDRKLSTVPGLATRPVSLRTH